MKNRFSTLDLIAALADLKQKVLGKRVIQVYDIDNKTYFLKLGDSGEKFLLLFESGTRIHTTNFEWPKNTAPSGFTMKLRKHLRNKRLESLTQVGVDRIVDMQFGIKEAAYHVILELYDKGNIVLTDYEYTILNILRPRTTGGKEDLKFIVREKYPVENARQSFPSVDDTHLEDIFESKSEQNIKKVLNSHLECGPQVIEHVLLKAGISPNSLIKDNLEKCSEIKNSLKDIETIFAETAAGKCKGYIIQKKNVVNNEFDKKEILTNVDFQPILFFQNKEMPYLEYESFNEAVDYFFSQLESQKIDMKTLQKEKDAFKKLENIKKDHELRINALEKSQINDTVKAQLIEYNFDLIDKAILIIRNLVANQLSWSDIWNFIVEAQLHGDQIAKAIKKLKFETNHFTMLLCNPYSCQDNLDSDEEECEGMEPQLVDIDLDLSAHANARKYYGFRRHNIKKQQKTIESSSKAYKSAEKKTKQALKEVAKTSAIAKIRKTYWFEKFQWFITSEKYLVIGGHDIQQNELVVKRYLKPGDIYVHADLHGASSVVIKNKTGLPVPPKSLNEAGAMALCYSAAWDAKVVTSAWWVYHHQVSKTAPTGEYLTAGSFIIRGKKNYLLPSHLVMGFSFLFKLDEDCIEKHKNENQSQSNLDEVLSIDSEVLTNDDSEVLTNDDSEVLTNDDSEKGSISSGESVDEVLHDVIYEEDGDCNCSENVADTCEDDVNQLSESNYFPDTKVEHPYIKDLEHETNKAEEFVTCEETTVLNEDCNKFQNRKENPPSQVERQSQCPKRGQRSKVKKIKEKYKNQDEEERNLRMKILASAGTAKEQKKKSKKEKEAQKKIVSQANHKVQKLQQKQVILELDAQCNEETEVKAEDSLVKLEVSDSKKQQVPVEEENEDQVDTEKYNEENIIDSLTGCPFPDDTLLFAIPVCAPYAAIQNYKFKVKLLPGSVRRGKAAKTALNIFLNDKNAKLHEKDLLRSVKDQDISRNFPGKVKLAAPNLSKLK